MASKLSESIDGTVRITASEIEEAFILTDNLSDIRIQQSVISVDLVANNLSINLLIREADIAVRMYKPVQSDLITRKPGGLELPTLPVWLTAHSGLRTSAGIRYVYDFLVEKLKIGSSSSNSEISV
ncbi:MAG: hypothetical protein V3U76_06690 [Granulosicoccus sp.]